MSGAWQIIPRQVPASACQQVSQIFHLAQLIFNTIADGVHLRSTQQTCRLFSQHVRTVKIGMTRNHQNERKVIENPTTDIKLNGAVSLFKTLFRPCTLTTIPDTIHGAALFVFQAPIPGRQEKQKNYAPVHQHQIPADLNQPPWNLFLSHPPILSAHGLEVEPSTPYRGPQFMHQRVCAQQSVTFRDILSLMDARHCLDTDMAFMVVLGTETEKETLRAAQALILKVGKQVSERMQKKCRVDERRYQTGGY